jgi:hypothetical protein
MSHLRDLDVNVASKFVLTNPRHAVEAVKTIELC